MENWMYAIATGVTGAAVIKLIDNVVQGCQGGPR